MDNFKKRKEDLEDQIYLIMGMVERFREYKGSSTTYLDHSILLNSKLVELVVEMQSLLNDREEEISTKTRLLYRLMLDLKGKYPEFEKLSKPFGKYLNN